MSFSSFLLNLSRKQQVMVGAASTMAVGAVTCAVASNAATQRAERLARVIPAQPILERAARDLYARGSAEQSTRGGRIIVHTRWFSSRVSIVSSLSESTDGDSLYFLRSWYNHHALDLDARESAVLDDAANKVDVCEKVLGLVSLSGSSVALEQDQWEALRLALPAPLSTEISNRVAQSALGTVRPSRVRTWSDDNKTATSKPWLSAFW